MSAGDVLFLGWSGDPVTKELEPTITYEPTERRDYITKRVTRRLMCFSKDRDAAIEALPVDNATLTSTYIDGNGAAQTYNMGSGWRLLNVDSSITAPGILSIAAVYEKDVIRALEFPGISDLTITCSNGIATLTHDETDLMTWDSGDGECTTGFRIEVDQSAIANAYPRGILWGQYMEATGTYYTSAVLGLATRVMYSGTIYVNDTAMETITVAGSDLPQKAVTVRISSETQTETGTGTAGSYNNAIAAAQSWISTNAWTAEDRANYLSSVQAGAVALGYTGVSVSVVESPYIDVPKAGDGLGNYAWTARISRSITVTASATVPDVPYNGVSATWSVSNNKLQLTLGNAVWLSFDLPPEP